MPRSPQGARFRARVLILAVLALIVGASFFAGSAPAATPVSRAALNRYDAALRNAQQATARATRSRRITRRVLRSVAASAPRTPRAAAIAAHRMTARATTTSSTPPAWPYCYRGNNGRQVDPLPSGTCVRNQLNPTSGATPRGTVILIASSGWTSGSNYVTKPDIVQTGKAWRDAGFQTVMVEHTSGVINGVGGMGSTGYQNVVQWYDLMRWYSTYYFGSRYPVCVAGVSSGGNLALLVPLIRTPSCVAAEAPPTDLAGLKGWGDGAAYQAAVNTFGSSSLAKWSPNAYASSPYYTMPIAIGTLPDDAVVPPAQTGAFASTHPMAKPMTLTPTGPSAPECSDYSLFILRQFGHVCLGGQQGVTQASLDAWHAQEVALISALAQ